MFGLAQWVVLSRFSIYAVSMITNNFWFLRTSTCCGLWGSISVFPSMTLSWFLDFYFLLPLPDFLLVSNSVLAVTLTVSELLFWVGPGRVCLAILLAGLH